MGQLTLEDIGIEIEKPTKTKASYAEKLLARGETNFYDIAMQVGCSIDDVQQIWEDLELKRKVFLEKQLYLESNFERISATDMYRYIFPKGSLETRGVKNTYKGNMIIFSELNDKRKNFVVTDDLEIIENFYDAETAYSNCCSYIGKTKHSAKARQCHGLIFDLDHVSDVKYIKNFFYYCDRKSIPTPTFYVNSGNGVHLYYIFEEPIPLYENVQQQLNSMKWFYLKYHFWIKTLSSYIEKGEAFQYQECTHFYRMPDSQTKLGVNYQCSAYKTGTRITMSEFNSYIDEKKYQFKGINVNPRSKTKLKVAKVLYPEWYEKVIINNQKCTGTYTFKNDNMYQAWKKKIKRFAKIGNRYKCIKTLVINAVKCDVPKDVLLQDIEILIDFFNMDPGAVINPFTEHDIECALAFYDERFKRTSVHSINSDFGSDVLERTKRNGKSMKEHVSEVMNVERDKSYPNGSWRGSGRKKGSTKDVTTSSKAQAIKEFLLKNPTASKNEVTRKTGFDHKTVAKWYDQVKELIESEKDDKQMTIYDYIEE